MSLDQYFSLIPLSDNNISLAMGKLSLVNTFDKYLNIHLHGFIVDLNRMI